MQTLREVIQWVWEHIFISKHVCIHLSKHTWVIVFYKHCLGENRIRNKVFVSCCTLCLWTLNWCWEFFFFPLSNHIFNGYLLVWGYLGRKSLCTCAHSHFIPSWKLSQSSFNIILRLEQLWFMVSFTFVQHRLHLSLCFMGYRWGDSVEMSLSTLWFGNTRDYCQWHWAGGILSVFSFLQTLENVLTEFRKKCFKQVNNSFWQC